jgi:hypothetical protein
MLKEICLHLIPFLFREKAKEDYEVWLVLAEL